MKVMFIGKDNEFKDFKNGEVYEAERTPSGGIFIPVEGGRCGWRGKLGWDADAHRYLFKEVEDK
jgi:hypothetical protein